MLIVAPAVVSQQGPRHAGLRGGGRLRLRLRHLGAHGDGLRQPGQRRGGGGGRRGRSVRKFVHTAQIAISYTYTDCYIKVFIIIGESSI